MLVADYKRTGKIETRFPLYIWTFTENSLTTKPGNHPKAMVGAYYRNKKVCEVFRQRLLYDRYCNMIVRMVADTYYTLNIPTIPQELQEVKEDFKQFWKEHKAEYEKVPPAMKKEIIDFSRSEHIRGEQEEDGRWQIGHVDRVDESITMDEWLRQLESED